MNKNDLKFIEHVKSECQRLGVFCDLRPSKYVKLSGNIACSGWFDSENLRLVVAMKRPDALSILVHEYAHITQWQDSKIGKFDLWDASTPSLIKVDEWLTNKPVKDIQKHLGICRDLELDNEKRSVKLIKQFKLSIDIPFYIKRANAYVLFYNWMFYTRRWSKPSNSPYSNPVVLEAMSTRFNMNYKKMSKKAYDAFLASKI